MANVAVDISDGGGSGGASAKIKSNGTAFTSPTYTATAGFVIPNGTAVTVIGTQGAFSKLSYSWEQNLSDPYIVAKTNTTFYMDGIPLSTEIIPSGRKYKKSETNYTFDGSSFYILYGNLGGRQVRYADFTEYTKATWTTVWVWTSSLEYTQKETPSSTVEGTNLNSSGTNVFSKNDSSSSPVVDDTGSPVRLLPGQKFEILDTKFDQNALTKDQKMYRIGFTVRGDYYEGWVNAIFVNGGADSTTVGNVSVTDGTPVSYGTGGTTVSTDTEDTSTEWVSRGYTDTNPDMNARYAEWQEYMLSLNDLDGIYDDEYYRSLSKRHFNTLGYPPKFNMDVDIQYTDQDKAFNTNNLTGTGVDITPGIGRVFGKTFLANPPILCICPGKVKMFPNLMGVERDNMIDLATSLAAGAGNASLEAKFKGDSAGEFSGKMYQFEADTETYGLYVNALCRACALLLNLGDEVVPNLGKKKLKNFDYAYWAIRSDIGELADEDDDTSIFKAFVTHPIKNAKRVYKSLVEDTTWLNFFLNGAETSVSESISTDVEASPLDSIFSTVNSLANSINYFTGSGFNLGTDASAATTDLFESLGIGTSSATGLIDVGKNILKGGKVVLPKMLSGSTYGKAISCSMKFVSPYGAPLSVFLKCILPICHLLALALPKQVSDNMYTYPFVVQAMQLGQFHVDLGVITNMNITRGGMDNTSWTVDSLATEWEVTFDIVPLVDELMVTGTNHPLLFVKNDHLVNYLGNMCGFNLIASNYDTKLDMLTSFITNKFTGYPRVIENRIVDFLYNRLGKFASVAWG